MHGYGPIFYVLPSAIVQPTVAVLQGGVVEMLAIKPLLHPARNAAITF